MIQNDRRLTLGQRIPERRHTARRKITALGYLLGLSALLVLVFQIWTIVQN